MPRIGYSPDELSTGGSSFDFGEGRGRVIAATVYNHEIPGYPPASCGFKLTIQRLDTNWKPTNDEPVDQFISAGAADEVTYESGGTAVAKFHPGKAGGSEEDFGGVEPWGNPKYDCGAEDQAEGNVLLVNPDWGKGPDKKSKIGIFGTSLIEHGVKKALLNGYAPNLVGLEAHFTSFMMEKPRNSKSKNDPTCMIVGKGGQVNGGETKDLIHKYPDAQTGAGKSASTAGKTTSIAAGKPKTNGAAAAHVAQTTAAAAAEPEAQEETQAGVGAGAGAGDAASETAEAILTSIKVAGAGQTISKTKLLTRVKTKLATDRVDPKLHKQIEALFNSDWLVGKADDHDIVLVGEGAGLTLTLPAAS